MSQSISVLNYPFQGPYESINNLKDEPGIYVILCSHNRELSVLDVGTAGEGAEKKSWNAQGVKRRVKGHNRKSYWLSNCVDNKLKYATKYVEDTEKRLQIEEELRWKFDPPCGTDPWDMNQSLMEELEQRYGNRGTTCVLENKNDKE